MVSLVFTPFADRDTAYQAVPGGTARPHGWTLAPSNREALLLLPLLLYRDTVTTEGGLKEPARKAASHGKSFQSFRFWRGFCSVQKQVDATAWNPLRHQKCCEAPAVEFQLQGPVTALSSAKPSPASEEVEPQTGTPHLGGQHFGMDQTLLSDQDACTARQMPTRGPTVSAARSPSPSPSEPSCKDELTQLVTLPERHRPRWGDLLCGLPARRDCVLHRRWGSCTKYNVSSNGSSLTANVGNRLEAKWRFNT
ncbi:hypothetical protein TgHK011_000636 [Trichoderma gracile]|nr:hypothetical protein TgHK011_000636 [Trichoderma gracile]